MPRDPAPRSVGRGIFSFGRVSQFVMETPPDQAQNTEPASARLFPAVWAAVFASLLV